MSSASRVTAAAVAAFLLLGDAIARAGDTRAPECVALDNSLLAVPDWYAAGCLGGNAVTDHSRYEELAGLVPGDPVYYKTLYPAPIGFAVAPLPFPLQLVSRNAQPIFALSVNPSNRQLYAIDNTTRQIGRPDVGIGAFNPIATLNPDPGPAFTISGLTIDPVSGGAYMVASDGAPSGSRLYRLNVNTGALTLVGTITNMPFVADIAFDGMGRLYAHDIGSDWLIQVNKTTAAPSVIGPTGLSANFAQGMMFDHSGNELYGCVFVTQPAQQGQLVRFNLTTGAATTVAGPIPDEVECAIAHPEGPCIAPIFAGIRSAASAGTSPCAINLGWSFAVACPGTSVKYNVYRSTTPGAPPSPATLVRSCLLANSYTDTDVVGGTRYYYRVVAEDNNGGANGACNGGLTSDGAVELSAVPVGPLTRVTDDVESGGGNWDATGGTGPNPWTIVTTQPHSPTHAWSVADPAVASDQRLRMVTPISVPAGGGELDFWHTYSTENSVDGHVLEYSLDGGTTWSDILGGQGSVPGNLTRFLQEGYDALIRPGTQSPLVGGQAWSGAQGYRHVRVDLGDFVGRDVTIRFRFASNGAVGGSGVWIDDISFTPGVGSCVMVPSETAAPVALAVDTAGNGVYQPNETVVVAPAWRNTGTGAIAAMTGTLTNHTGPAGPVYTIPDSAANYGSIAVGATGSCSSTGNCYSVANVAATRPATHWDSTALETVTASGATKTWTLHVGDSFTDVLPASGFYRFVETILHKGVTGGCTGTTYCPTGATTREQLAVFVLVAREPAGYSPPACGATPMFTDVPASSPFCRWIEELARRGVVGGCGPGTFCPSGRATREQMAVIVLRTLDVALNPPPCTTPMFTDVPASSPYCRWIEELVRRGVVSGCGAGVYCPTANVTREQMAVFLTVTFGFTLYGL